MRRKFFRLSRISFLAILPVALFAQQSSVGSAIPVLNRADATDTISGQVTVNGFGLGGVNLNLGGTQNATTVTDSTGSYSFTGLAAGGTYTLTPSLAGYTFTPVSPLFANLNGNQVQNFVAVSAVSVVISGLVTVSGSPLSGVTVNVNGSQSSSAVTDSGGSYSIVVTKGGSYTVSAASLGYSLSAPVTYNNLNANQISNFSAAAATGLQFYPVTPCRIVDTRIASFPSGFGAPSMSAQSTRTFFLTANPSCGIPSTAAAYSLNVTAVTKGYLGFLSIWESGQPMPNVSTLNSYSQSSTAVANAAIVPAGFLGGINVYVTDPTDVVLDIDGYFAPPAASGLVFYPVTPCRLVDTRVVTFPSGFGPPSMSPASTRTFTLPNNPACSIPPTASAYSLNVTAVPQKTLGILTLWPAGSPQPNVSTLNVYASGAVVANAAIVPAGTGGAINAFVTDQTDLVLDINGYYAPPSANGLKFYPLTPCRVADTRGAGFTGPFGSPGLAAATQRSFPVSSGSCEIPSGAGAYSFNFTAVPQARQLGIFTAWPTGIAMPNVSTMNSFNGSVVSNAAVVPAGAAGAISVFVTDASDVLFDVNGYFAP